MPLHKKRTNMRILLFTLPLVLCLGSEVVAQSSKKSATQQEAAPTKAAAERAPVVKPGQPWLGVSRWWANESEVVLLGVLKDGPAGKAGLQAGDAIVSIAGEPIHTLDEFQQALDGLKTGDRTRIEISRQGELETVLVKLEPLPPDGGVGRIRAAADAGETWAMCELGIRLAFQDQDTSFVKRDPAEAARWFQRALKMGNSVAPLFLGLMSAKGNGVPLDHAEAQQLLMQARQMNEDGVPKGMASAASNQLAIMCLLGQGGAKDQTLALRFFQDAAAQGSLAAMHRIGVMFEHGIGVSQDSATAALWYQRAGDLGYEPAQHSIVWLTVNAEVASGLLESVSADEKAQTKPAPIVADQATPATPGPNPKTTPPKK